MPLIVVYVSSNARDLLRLEVDRVWGARFKVWGLGIPLHEDWQQEIKIWSPTTKVGSSGSKSGLKRSGPRCREEDKPAAAKPVIV